MDKKCIFFSFFFFLFLTSVTSVFAVSINNENQKAIEQQDGIYNDIQEVDISNYPNEDENLVQKPTDVINPISNESDAVIDGNGYENSDNASDQYQSEVSTVIQGLEKIANEDKEIGDELKVIIQTEKNLSEQTKKNINTAKERSNFMTFLIGSDYENLGKIRSRLVTTRNSIEKLIKVLETITSVNTKTELQNQIENLLFIQTRIENFIKNEETQGNFSLFGWLVKLF